MPVPPVFTLQRQHLQQQQQQQHVAHVHETAAYHLIPIPEFAVVDPADDPETLVTSYSCCRLLLFWARELITSFSLPNHILKLFFLVKGKGKAGLLLLT